MKIIEVLTVSYILCHCSEITKGNIEINKIVMTLQCHI